MCARVITYTGTRERNAVRMSIIDGVGIQFGCVCTIASVFAGNAPIHRPVLGSPGSGHGTLTIAPLASRTRNAACSSVLNPYLACSIRCQKMRSAAGSAATSPRSATGASHAITSNVTAPASITATTVEQRIAHLLTVENVDAGLRESDGVGYRTVVSESEHFVSARCARSR